MKKKILLAGLFFCSSLQTHYKKDLIVGGTLDFCDGLGRIVYGVFDQLGSSLNIGLADGNVRSFYYDPFSLRSRVQTVPVQQKTYIFLYTSPLVTLLTNTCYKNCYHGALKIAYSMFESDAIPDECVEILNNEFDLVVVPDQFLIPVYRTSGVTIPVYCLPTGLYLQEFLDIPEKTEHSRPFIFGSAGKDIFRKNLKKLVDAFILKYGNNPDYLFKLHISYAFNDDETLEDYVEKKGITNIEISSDTITQEEFLDFIASLDCYITLSTGEGFSNTPREAIAAGIPCIISNNTGHMVIADSGCAIPVACPIKIGAYYEALSRVVGFQYDCDIKDVIAAMEDVVINYDLHLKKVQKGKDWVSQYLWSALKDDYLTLFDPSDVQLSQDDKIDGATRTMYTSDPAVYQKYKNIIQQKKVDVTLSAPSGFCDGIGRIGYGIIDTLTDDLSIISYQSNKKNAAYQDYENIDDPYGVQKKIEKTNRLDRSPVFLYIDSINGYLQDSSYTKAPKDSIRFAYSMFESSAIPQAVATKLNSYFDACIVPDPYHIQVYKDSGVTIPLFCLPTGLYLEKFLEEPLRQQPHDRFTFGVIATNSPRKNLKKVIQAFADLYGNNPDYCLKIHTKKMTMTNFSLDTIGQGLDRLFERLDTTTNHHSIGDFFKQLPTPEESAQEVVARLGLSNVVVSTDIMTEQQYLDYFKTLDCYLSLSMGEGFSNTPREAMALGIPTIVSNNTAQTTICNSGFVISVPSSKTVNAVYQEFSESLGFQYDCDLDDVKMAMLDVVKNYQQYCKKASFARSWVKQYLWTALKEDYAILLKPQKVSFGAENKIDSATKTLVTNDYNFYKKMQDKMNSL